MNNKNYLAAVVAGVVILGGAFFLMNKKATAPTTEKTVVEPTVSVSATKKETIISENADGFLPATLTVKKGTTVVFTNKSGSLISVNSANHPTHLLYPKLNLGEIEDGQSKSLQFNDVGSFGFHDHLNPSRFGKVIVEE